jgi:hypothetical protein
MRNRDQRDAERAYLMKLVSTMSSTFGIDLMMPISSNRSAAS